MMQLALDRPEIRGGCGSRSRVFLQHQIKQLLGGAGGDVPRLSNRWVCAMKVIL